jgi:hypothetical protein
MIYLTVTVLKANDGISSTFAMKLFLDCPKEINSESIKDLSVYQRIYDYSAEGSSTRISLHRQSFRKCDESLTATELKKRLLAEI